MHELPREFTQEFQVDAAHDGLRLDQTLRSVLGLGLREARRLCDAGTVLVNGRPAGPGLRLKAGLRVCVCVCPGPAVAALPGPALQLLHSTGHLAFFNKPAGLHSAGLAASPGAEDQLRSLYPGALLLNRLDQATSGILAAALTPEGRAAWQAAQNAGQTVKHYLALAQGCLDGERLVTNRLALKNRDRVLTELAPHPDARRHTRVRPLALFRPGEDGLPRPAGQDEGAEEADGPYLTLLGCVILKGARHQVRAHLALLGHPLWGDVKYGGLPLPGADAAREAFYLHHDRLELPALGLEISCPPPWPWMEENIPAK